MGYDLESESAHITSLELNVVAFEHLHEEFSLLFRGLLPYAVFGRQKNCHCKTRINAVVNSPLQKAMLP